MYISIYLNRLASWLVTSSYLSSTMFPRLNENVDQAYNTSYLCPCCPRWSASKWASTWALFYATCPMLTENIIQFNTSMYTYTSLSREPFALAPDKVPKAIRRRKRRSQQITLIRKIILQSGETGVGWGLHNNHTQNGVSLPRFSLFLLVPEVSQLYLLRTSYFRGIFSIRRCICWRVNM